MKLKCWPVCLLMVYSVCARSSESWVYSCNLVGGTAQYTSPSYYKTSAAASFQSWGIGGEQQLSASDNQSLDNSALNDDINALQQNLVMTGKDAYWNSSSTAIIYSVDTSFSGNGAPPPYIEGDMGVSLNCGGWGNCANVSIADAGWFSWASTRRVSFKGGVSVDAPVTSMSVTMPSGPKNEYEEHRISFTYTIQTIGVGVASSSNINIPTGDQYYPPNAGSNVTYITCSRASTPLALTLSKSDIDFGRIQSGNASPVTQKLNWTASGTGQASIWTLTFDTDADKKDGDNILLGNAKVRILDAGSTQVPLATPVNISGVTGAYTFELDPTGATPGTPETSVNVTLTAN